MDRYKPLNPCAPRWTCRHMYARVRFSMVANSPSSNQEADRLQKNSKARKISKARVELFDRAPRQLSAEEDTPDRLYELVRALATGRLKAAGKLSRERDEWR